MRLVGRVLTPLLLTVLLVLPGTGPIAAAAAQTVPEPPPPLVITEVMQDNAGTPNDQDWFEYFEVHNPTDADIDFTDYRLRYHSGAWLTAVEEGSETPLAEAIIPAGGTAVFWLRYAVGTGDAAVTQWQLGEADFREHFGDADSDYPLFHVIGQNGFANSGARALRLFDETRTTIVTEAHYDRPATDRGRSDHFALPATGAVLSAPTAGAPTPGVVDAARLVRPEPAPEPDPTEPEAEPVLGTDGNAAEVAPLVITEINGDNDGTDHWEFLEVVNTTEAPIDLDAAGIEIRYHTSQWNAGTVQPLIRLDGEGDDPAVIPAGGVAVLWMNYGEGDVRRGLAKDEFRAFYGIDADVQILRFGPQGGFANAGDRGFSISDADGVITRAWVPADDGDSTTPWNAQFAVPDLVDSADARLIAHAHGADVAPTPGAITLDQVTSRLQSGTDPDLADAPILMITELAPDTANVNGSDGYEFIEVYNASDAPVDWGDYTLNYLYTNNALSGPTTNSATLWPSVPADVVIEPRGTLVLWVKNPAGVEAGLTVDDFNAEFGTSLVLGETIVELYNGGMANGGSRGLQVQTNTGHDISRAYYFDNDQTTATTAIQYAWNPGPGDRMWEPVPADGAVQTMLGLAPPTPGAVSREQVPAGLVPAPAAGAAPVVDDLTGTSDAPSTGGVDLAFRVVDDVLVRTVRLQMTDNLGATEERLLAVGSEDLYTYSVPSADLFGKRWLEYTVVAGDGAQTSTLGPVRIDLVDGEPDPVRLDLVDGGFVSGAVPVTATADGDPAGLELVIDGAPVEGVPSLETGPVFAFEATATDAFFRNGVQLGDEVLTIFDEGFYSRVETVDATVPVDRIRPGEPLTLTIAAGTKAWPGADIDENNDDFSAMNFRLALPDGRVLRAESCATTHETPEGETDPAPYACPTDSSTRVGFSDTGLVTLHLTFAIPDDAFDSIAAIWDTTAVADGAHTVEARRGDDVVVRTVHVDNTAPVVTSGVEDGSALRGEFVLDGEAVDAGSGVTSLAATLDGEPIALPHATSSLELEPGEHSFAISAVDAVGNTTTHRVVFTTADERPGVAPVSPADEGTAEEGSVELSATVTSPEGDALDVSFREGYEFVPTDPEIGVVSGTVQASDDLVREGEPLSAEQLEALVGADGVDVEVSSGTALPYQLFTVAVPADAGDGASVRASWTGTANADARVTLYALTADGGWEQVDQHLAADDAAFELGGTVPVEGFAVDGVVTLLVQHTEGFAGAPGSTRDSAVEPFHPDATPRDAYDFTIAWESDTQYYNRNEGVRAGTGGDDTFYRHQLSIHEFVLAERDDLNIQYLVHTGDIVDSADQPHQWLNADDAYRMLDEAGLPYGVLAGNHDVLGGAADYTHYGEYFGDARFEGNPWFGGSYKNNRGHYDLISANGLDLLVLYMGWPDNVAHTELNSEDIAWMNSVIEQYPERHVWINLHEYMLTTGGLGPFPQRILDEVVAPNPNVFAVGSGHYHDAYTRYDEFDDDGDGVADRTVTSMLFDYQGLEEGGLGYLRLLHFDNVGERILVRTYSPSLDVFDSDHPSLNDPAGMQDFELPYALGGLEAQTKTLATDAFRAEVLTTKEIAAVAGVASGTTVTVEWTDAGVGERGWYVVATGPHGGEAISEVSTLHVTARADVEEPGEPGTEDPGTGEPGAPGTEEPGTGEPGEPGTDEPGTGEPGEPGTDEPGTDEPGTDEPGTDRPGADRPATPADPAAPAPDAAGDDLASTGAGSASTLAGTALVLLLAGAAALLLRRGAQRA